MRLHVIGCVSAVEQPRVRSTNKSEMIHSAKLAGM